MRRETTPDPLSKFDVLRLLRSARLGDDPGVEVVGRLEAAVAEAEAAPDGVARNKHGDPVGTASELAALLAQVSDTGVTDERGAS